MADYYGDFIAGATVQMQFNTTSAINTLAALIGTPVVSVYKNGTTAESVAGVALTTNFDSRTGLNIVSIDLSADGSFYSAGNDYTVVVTTGLIGIANIAGLVVGSFSIANRSAIMLASVIESGVSLMKMLQYIGAMVGGGDVSGAGSGTEVFKAVGNPGTTRITIPVDGSGNRTGTVLS